MNTTTKILFFLVAFLASLNSSIAQHRNQLFVEVDTKTHTLNIKQEIDFFNASTDSISEIVLNDWNNAYSDVKTPLARRFSDEFYRGFHLAKEEDRGKTFNLTISNHNHLPFLWERTQENPDLVSVKLTEKLAPNEKINLRLTYTVKIPSNKFTRVGYDNLGNINLEDWFLTPARYENHDFVKQSNENLDDIANAICNFDIQLKLTKTLALTTDLNTIEESSNNDYTLYKLNGENRVNFSLFIEPKSTFTSFKSNSFEVLTNLDGDKVTLEDQAKAIDGGVRFVKKLVGDYPFKKIVVSQTDYEKNPFYGLNQLPSIIRPFTDEFTFEIKFLKTYLSVFLNNSLFIDNRNESWVHNGIQVYAMMKYIEENHPDAKMLGKASTFKLLKSFNLTNLDFNEQYSYFYMLMARKNLDQPLGAPKNTLIKFNEQIASKYRAGLSLRYLNSYLENQAVTKAINEFYTKNQGQQIAAIDFENQLKQQTPKDIDWFFKTIINSRDLIDYKFNDVTKTKDSIQFSVKSKKGINVPIPVYGLYKGNVVFKKWIEPTNDSIFKFERNNANKIVLNYKNEVPEYNLRNNWKSFNSFFPNNRPIKFVFMKDLEDPYYNQLLYLPTLEYNLYDGFITGIRLHNKTLLDKPFIFDVNPAYSTNTATISGSGSFSINQNYRNSRLYNVKYSFSGSYFHYAPDAAYTKLTPSVQLRIRENDFRDNRKQLISIRQILVNREKSAIITENSTENYSVFNVKYFNTRTEVTKHFNLMGDIQFSDKFGKIAGQIEYRKLFENNRQVNLRFYAGTFLYNNSNSDFFSFALDRPSDYLFDYGYYGRSESTGFYSQQLIIAEGGFKSKLDTPSFANQWISTANAGYTIWNWIEMYGDIGFLKNRNQNPTFRFDSGIRLNLVTDYFELYLPVYSSNGWEVGQKNYNEKIRFIITFSPKILVNLFNRKWF